MSRVVFVWTLVWGLIPFGALAQDAAGSAPLNSAQIDRECETVQGMMLRGWLARQPRPDEKDLYNARLLALKEIEVQENACRTANSTPEGAAQWKAEQQRLMAQGAVELQKQDAESRAVPRPPPELGIVDGVEGTTIGPGFPQSAKAWVGYVDGILVSVDGSAYPTGMAKQGLGIVYIQKDVPDPVYAGGWDTISEDVYDAPAGIGYLTVVSASNGIVDLKDRSGHLVHFNVRNMTFE